MSDIDLVQKLGENERELALLRDDLNALKEQRDGLQQDLSVSRSDLKEALDQLNHLEKKCHKAETDLFDTMLEMNELKSALEQKNSEAIVSGAARNEFEEKLKMSEFQNSKLRQENEMLRRELQRSKQYEEQRKPESDPRNDDNPYEYRSPYTRQALYEAKYFSDGIRFDDYDFGYIKVGQPAALAGKIDYNNGNPIFVPGKLNTLDMCSRYKTSPLKYTYAGIDKVKRTALISFSGYVSVNSEKGIGYADSVCEVPLTHCFNIHEIDRWYSEWHVDDPEPSKSEKNKRGLFKKR
ncbi:MAG: hypothetical protein E7222_13050 [Clostridiales bacterium]|nr:hypothetical protein [Clostridiales bacterium]